MKSIIFNQTDIENKYREAKSALLDINNINFINYPNSDLESFDKNNQSLLKTISGNDIVYCIWSGNSQISMNPKYIGHTAGKTSRQRIRNHLTSKHKKTGAQLERVKKELEQGRYIGLTYIIIEPAYMRTSLEEWLLAQPSINLKWNQIGRTIKS